MPVSTPSTPSEKPLRRSNEAASIVAGSLPKGRWWATLVAVAVIVLASVAAFSNSFSGAMVLDDHAWILDNPSIQHLSPIGDVLFPPNSATVGGRPLVSLSLAINYALGGTDVWGYHAVNLAIHILAALVLFGIVRRTLLLPGLRDRFGSAATALALGVALLWAVHPLQTAAVTYIIQRTESLMGLLYLLTLYCFIRGATLRADSTILRVCWYAAATIACLLGMATKEVMCTAPLVVLIYDATFLAGSLRKALKTRPGLYALLAASWSVAILMLALTNFHGGTTGFAVETFTWQSYLLTEPGVIVHYLQLAIWPAGLCLDYNWPPAETVSQIVIPGTIVIALLGATILGLLKRSSLGFLGAAFFLILAPTSSFIPIKDAAFDHRMYLPLAALAALVVIGVYAVWERLVPRPEEEYGRAEKTMRWGIPVALLTIATVALCWFTVARNNTFRSEETIWQDVKAKRPDNGRAYANLGNAALKAGDAPNAVKLYETALKLNPKDAQVHLNLGQALDNQDRTVEAIDHYRRAVKLQPDSAQAHFRMGTALAKQGQTDDAIAEYQEAVRLDRDDAQAHSQLADALVARGNFDEAINHAESALAINPSDAQAHGNLGAALAGKGKLDEAIKHLQQAVEIDPTLVKAGNELGAALNKSGRFHESIGYLENDIERHPRDTDLRFQLATAYDKDGQGDKAFAQYLKILDLASNHVAARIGLAEILLRRGDLEAALEQFEKALEIDANNVALQMRVAGLYVKQGDNRQAIVHYQTALSVEPRNAVAEFALASCFLAEKMPDDAIGHLQKAIAMQPENAEAQDMLGTLLGQQRKFDEAREHFEKAVALDPKRAESQYKLGLVLYQQGKPAEGVKRWRIAVQLKPNQLEFLRNLPLILATDADASVRNGAEAVELAQRAVDLTERHEPVALAILAAAYAEAGQFPKAVTTAEQALELAQNLGNGELADQLTERLKLYRAGKPYHDKAK